VLAATARASEPAAGADEIMARVAVNQDAAEHARSAYVYRQKVAIRLRDSHNKLVREETSDYQVMPDAERTRKDLVGFNGQYRKGRSMVTYDKPREGKDEGVRNQIDGDLARDMRDDLVGNRKSKDGLAPELFPLTGREQRKYRFTLKGEETYQGTPVYRIAFEPKRDEHDETCWKGETLVSKTDFQPFLVTTKLAFAIPFLVRTALGTNLHGLGFSVEYRKFDDGVWFPVSYGTEFNLSAVFFYSRKIAVSMVNSDFRRADVQSSVDFDTVK
jgi:hypothetical protein